MNQVVDFINVHRDRYVDELKQYLAIPSISALPEHAADVRRAAQWTAEEKLRRAEAAGVPVTVIDTSGPLEATNAAVDRIIDGLASLPPRACS